MSDEPILGRIRVFRPIVPRMWPQQVPCFRYVEVPLEESQVKRSPVVSWEEFDAAKKLIEKIMTGRA